MGCICVCGTKKASPNVDEDEILQRLEIFHHSFIQISDMLNQLTNEFQKQRLDSQDDQHLLQQITT